MNVLFFVSVHFVTAPECTSGQEPHQSIYGAGEQKYGIMEMLTKMNQNYQSVRSNEIAVVKNNLSQSIEKVEESMYHH